MKKFLLFLSVVFIFAACKKTKPDNIVVRYEFTSDVSATYQIDYAVSDTTTSSELLTGTSWIRNVIISNNGQPDFLTVARLRVYAPDSWANTTNSAHVNLKILVNAVEKVNVDTLMTSANADTGIVEMYTF